VQPVRDSGRGQRLLGLNPCGANFPGPVQTPPRPPPPPASYTVGTGSFQGVKLPGHGAAPLLAPKLPVCWSYTCSSLLCLLRYAVGWPLPLLIIYFTRFIAVIYQLSFPHQVLNGLNVALIGFVDLLQARCFRNLLVLLDDLLPR